MEGLILGVNTLYRLFCFFKLFPMVSKGLTGKYITVEPFFAGTQAEDMHDTFHGPNQNKLHVDKQPLR